MFMKNRCLFALLLLICLACQNDKKSASNIYTYIPENTSLLIKSNSLENLRSSSKNNNLFQNLKTYTNVENFESNLSFLKYLKPTSDCLIAFSKDSNDSIETSVITHYDSAIFLTDSIKNFVSETITSERETISKLEIDNTLYYASQIDSFFFVTNRLKLLKSALQTQTSDSNIEFQKLMQMSKPNTSASIIVNLENNQFQPKLFLNPASNDASFSDYLVLDVDINQNDLIANGITKANDSTESLINVFKNTVPQENSIHRIAPSNTDYFVSLTFNDAKLFQDQLNRHSSKDSISDQTFPFETLTEAGYVKSESNEAVILKSIDPTSTFENLPQEVHSVFRSVNIYKFDNSASLENLFSPFFELHQLDFYMNLEDYFIFSNNSTSLENIISNIQNNTTLSESSGFKEIMNNLSDESSILTYANPKGLQLMSDLNFGDHSEKVDLNNYKSSAVQFVYDSDFAHVHSVFKTSKSRSNYNAVSEDFNISIDQPILGDIQLLKNHTNNKNDIALQDINNNLYLISDQGKVFWKKQLDGKILGSIEQIDIYKNGRLQLAFSTKNKLYVLDRNGKNVAPFPLSFNDDITQPLSVFDYDKKRKYRLMVTQGKNVLMYDQKGKIVSGFKYKNAQSNINSQPKHFRIGRKDYIVFKDGNRLEILDRVGRRRIDVKASIDFSNNDIYLYNNKFSTTNTKGELLEVNQSGSIKRKNLNLNPNHSLSTTSKTLVALSDNKLTIKSNTITLDFGDYTNPKIFYINNKIYVSVTDKQAKKVYLFDSQAKSIPNFPVYGTSAIEMNDIDNDNSIEVIVKGDDKSLIVYKLN